MEAKNSAVLPGSECQEDTAPYPPQANKIVNWVLNGVHLNRQSKFQSEKKNQITTIYCNVFMLKRGQNNHSSPCKSTRERIKPGSSEDVDKSQANLKIYEIPENST